MASTGTRIEACRPGREEHLRSGFRISGGRASKMYCTKCGTELRATDRFCSQCASRTRAFAATEQTALMLDKRNKKIAGVCGGFARYLDVDVTLVRVLWLGIAFCT